MPSPLVSFAPPPPGRARLITDNGDPLVLTADRETDARTALTRGLAEYLEQIQIDAVGGRHLLFEKVFSTWAEQEDAAIYPSAAVYSDEPGAYDASRLSPGVNARTDLPDGRFLISGAEYVLNMMIDIRASDPESRQMLVAMLEDAFVPVDYRYGLLLELPFYFNERATYELLSGNYRDGETTAQQRVRQGILAVRGILPMQRLMPFGEAIFKVRNDGVSTQEGGSGGTRLSF